MAKKEKIETSNGCLLGSNWWVYILCIICVILFALLIVWLSTYWSTASQICSRFAWEIYFKSIF